MPEWLPFVLLNLFITIVLACVVGFLLWQAHSRRHREITALITLMGEEVRSLENQIGERALATHKHPYAAEVHDHPHEHPHEHPHQHEHVQHTHTLVKRSEHEEQGRKVVVKACEECGTIFRDKES